jgi:hypothetical protein
MLDSIFKKRYVWTTGLFSFEGNVFDRKNETLLKRFSPDRLRLAKNYTHTLADPFLFVMNDRLFLFLERKREFEKGQIIAFSTADLVAWNAHGIVLKEPFHLSYPYVFQHKGTVYMLPETHQAGAVVLYRASNFPNGWEPARTLLKGAFGDPTLYVAPDRVYLWATDAAYQLHLFHAASLEDEFLPHPASPITSDMRFSRSAGAPFFSEQHGLVRFAQDCHKTYGERVYAIQIETLSPTEYREKLLVDDFVPKTALLGSIGVHHFHSVSFQGKQLYATDGLRYDSLFNNWVYLLFRLRGYNTNK